MKFERLDPVDKYGSFIYSTNPIKTATTVSKGMQSSRSRSFCLGRLLVTVISAQYHSFLTLYANRHRHMLSMRLAVQYENWSQHTTPKTHCAHVLYHTAHCPLIERTTGCTMFLCASNTHTLSNSTAE
jgi:hypothetical protein